MERLVGRKDALRVSYGIRIDRETMRRQRHPWKAGSGSGRRRCVGKAILRTQKERVHTYGVEERLEDWFDLARRTGPASVGVMFMRSSNEAIVGMSRWGGPERWKISCDGRE